ncbi:Uncharacterised protein r2_g126 [Pycnogonum litorale]
MDEIGFMGVNLGTDEYLQVEVARRKGNVAQYVVHFVVLHENVRKEFELPVLPQTLTRSKELGSDCWVADGLKIWCAEPTKRWRLSFNGFLREKKSRKVCHVTFSYVWVSFSRVIDLKDDTTADVRAEALVKSEGNDARENLSTILDQYDQWGTFYGCYSIDGEAETELLLWGSKIRRIGNFCWKNIHRFINIKGYVSDGSALNFLAISSPPQIPEVKFGYIELGESVRHLIKSVDFELNRFESFQTDFPSVLSIRIKTDCDDYILELNCDDEIMSWLWGTNEEVVMQSSNVKIALTSLYHDLRLEGLGTFTSGRKNADKPINKLDKLPTLLLEPDINEIYADIPSILSFSEVLCQSSKLVGGKGSSLALLTQISGDFKVPNGFCITVSANGQYIEQNNEIKLLIAQVTDCCSRKDNLNTEQECIRLSERFVNSNLSDKLKGDIRSKLEDIFGKNYTNIRFAVRSSAIGEDGDEMSAAGQMETILGCKGLEQIFNAVKKCWGSCYGFRAVEYRRQNGQPIKVGMSVVVQEMVASEIAGVLFTRHPVTTDPSIISISANYGNGESVVSAISDPDTIVVNRTFDNELTIGEITIGKKQTQILMNDDGGMKEVEIDDPDHCCLTLDQALALAKISVLVEQSYCDPRDIEWAITGDRIYLLQARPITNLHIDPEIIIENGLNSAMVTNREFGTSGNFKEVFPGATSPLGLSLFHQSFNISSSLLASYFGNNRMPNLQHLRGTMKIKLHRFVNRGEMTYASMEKHVSNYRLKIMKGMDIGLNGRIIDDGNLREEALKRFKYVSKYSSLLGIVWTTMMMIRCAGTLDRAKKKYGTFTLDYDYCRTSEELAEKLINNLAPHAEILSTHIGITVTSVILNTLVLLDLLGTRADFEESHYSDFALLMSVCDSSNEVESADIPAALKVLADEIAEKIDEKDFLSMSKEQVVDLFTSKDSILKEGFNTFITKHGHRCYKEFDVMSNTWAMDPSQLVIPLQSLLRAKHLTKKNKLNIDQALRRLKSNLSDKTKKRLRTNVLKARQQVAYREQAKSLLIRVVDQYRRQLRRLSRMMVAEGRIPDESLMFFMSSTEIKKLIKTRSAKIIQTAVKRRRLHPKLDSMQFDEISIGMPKPVSNPM